MKKKMLAALLACVLICGFVLVGCDGGTQPTTNGNASSGASTEGNTGSQTTTNGNASSGTTGSSISYTTFEGNGYSIEIDNTWSAESDVGFTFIIRSPQGTEGYPRINISEMDYYPESLSQNRNDQMDALRMTTKNFTAESGNEYRYSNVQEGSFGSNALISYELEVYKEEELTSRYRGVLFYVAPGFRVEIEYSVNVDYFDRYRADMEHVIGSVKPL